jgi:nifR3 family TIM-barrel protein
MSRAAKIVQDKGADLLDVNFGCSVKKIVKTGAGAALMKKPLLAEKILKSIKKVLRVPLTIKCRSGWKTTGEQALELARIAENCGVDAITVHPRSVSQKFSGSADWSVIEKIKQAVSIPVIGNGDVKQPADAVRMFEKTGCDAVMIGRFAVGDPWIFSRIIQLAGNGSCQPVDPDIRFDAMLRYLDHSIRYYGEKRACNMLRGRLGWLSKTLPHNNIFKESIKRISSREEAVSIIEAYKNHFILPESSKEAILPGLHRRSGCLH